MKFFLVYPLTNAFLEEAFSIFSPSLNDRFFVVTELSQKI